MPIQQATRRLSSRSLPLTPEQLRRILELSADDPKMRDLHDVAVIVSGTGIRQGELRELRWTDVDVHECRLIVNAGTAYRRVVPFGPRTLQILEARRERELESEFVLGDSSRGRLQRVSRQLRIVCEGIHISGVTLHLLRRTFFGILVSSGISLLACRSIGGYRTLNPLIEHIPS